jgi:hypothetical protein
MAGHGALFGAAIAAMKDVLPQWFPSDMLGYVTVAMMFSWIVGVFALWRVGGRKRFTITSSKRGVICVALLGIFGACFSAKKLGMEQYALPLVNLVIGLVLFWTLKGQHGPARYSVLACFTLSALAGLLAIGAKTAAILPAVLWAISALSLMIANEACIDWLVPAEQELEDQSSRV